MLQINPEKIPTIDKLVVMAQPILNKRKLLYERINRSATQSTMMFSGSDKVQVAYEQQNVGVATGYLGGTAPTIKNIIDDELNKEYLNKINDILRYNDFAAKHLNVARDTISANAHYLYIYANMQGRILFSGVDGKNAVAFYDYEIEPNVVLLLRQWTETDEDNKVINIAETISKTQRIQYENSSAKYVPRGTTESLSWGDIPVCSFENNNDIALIEPIIPLVKMFEQIIGNIASMTKYNDEAKLLMIGYEFETPYSEDNSGVKSEARKFEEAELLASKILQLDCSDGNSGDFRWLLKEINYSGMLEVLKTIQQLIMFIVASPDTTDTTFSAAESSLALRLKMFPFEQAATMYKATYKKQYLRLIEIMTNRLNFLKDPTLTNDEIATMSREDKKARGLYDFANIEIEVNVNVPSDKLKALNVAAEMARMNIFSDKTILAETGMVKDIEAEIESKKQQDFTPTETTRIPMEDTLNERQGMASKVLEVSRQAAVNTAQIHPVS